MRGIYAHPMRMSDIGVNAWGFTVGGFRFMAKMDRRPWPEFLLGLRREMVVNGNDRLYGFVRDFDGSTEHIAALKMAGAHFGRQQAKTR